jgi:hypothetical protein
MTWAETAEYYRLNAKAHRLHSAAYEAEAMAYAIEAAAGDTCSASQSDDAILYARREFRDAEEADQNYLRCRKEADKQSSGV